MKKIAAVVGLMALVIIGSFMFHDTNTDDVENVAASEETIIVDDFEESTSELINEVCDFNEEFYENYLPAFTEEHGDLGYTDEELEELAMLAAFVG